MRTGIWREKQRVIGALRAVFDALCMGTCRAQKQWCDWRADTAFGEHGVLWDREAGRDESIGYQGVYTKSQGEIGTVEEFLGRGET